MIYLNKIFIMVTRLGMFGLVLSLLLSLMSCKSTLEVEGNFPTPVINIIPLNVGIIYEEQFRSYRYIEKNEERNEWDIGIGKSQVKLFNTVLSAMFKSVVVTKNEKLATNISADVPSVATDTSIDLFFKPKVEEFQYNVPDETNINMFEVWIKYNMKVYDDQGQLIADWIQTAYGKTPTAFFKSQKRALNEAMIIALRDIGAVLSLRFIHIPEINNWLKQKHSISQIRKYYKKNKSQTELITVQLANNSLNLGYL